MMSKKELHLSIDAQLVEFGQSLNPSEAFHEKGRQLAHNVFLKLEELLPKECSVAEPRFAGSFGKATDVIEPDLDLYVVVNNHRPPFDSVLDGMEDIIQKHQDKLEIQKGSIKHSTLKPRVSMQFSFLNGMDTDLLPAANMEPEQVLAEIAKDPEKNYYMYNTSLVAVQLAFMKSQDSFTHSLIRLSKFWMKSLSFGERKFPGGSTIMELIGCAAAEDELKFSGKRSMLQALNRVMQMVCDIDSLKLAFEPVSSQGTSWRRVPFDKLNPTASASLIPTVVGTKEILRRKCFIIDPANPYYDHLNGKDMAMIQLLKKFAVETKRRLAIVITGARKVVDFVGIFKPQPASFKKDYPMLQLPNDFCVEYAFQSPPSSFPYLKVRRWDILARKEIRLVIDSIKWNLLSLVHSMFHSSETVTVPAIQAGVDDLIKSSFCISAEIPALAYRDRHDEMNVTIYIPYNLNNKMYAVKFSMTWR